MVEQGFGIGDGWHARRVTTLPECLMLSCIVLFSLVSLVQASALF